MSCPYYYVVGTTSNTDVVCFEASGGWPRQGKLIFVVIFTRPCVAGAVLQHSHNEIINLQIAKGIGSCCIAELQIDNPP